MLQALFSLCKCTSCKENMEKTKEISIGEPVAISNKKDHFKKTTAAIHADR